MNLDTETPDKAKRTLGLVIVVSMFVSLSLILVLLQWTHL